jgi:hypothetical protein
VREAYYTLLGVIVGAMLAVIVPRIEVRLREPTPPTMPFYFAPDGPPPVDILHFTRRTP